MTQGAVGFVGLGVMGEPICRNLTAKSGRRVVAYDIDPAPLACPAAIYGVAGCINGIGMFYAICIHQTCAVLI